MPSITHPYATDLERLLHEKSFEELDLQERAWVLSEMEAGEYRQMRELVLLASRYLEKATPKVPRPRADIQPHLHARLQARKDWHGRMRQLLDYRIPAWQAAAAVGLIFFLIQFGRPAIAPIPSEMSAQQQIADSTHNDSSFRRVLDLGEDSVLARMQRETDTL